MTDATKNIPISRRIFWLGVIGLLTSLLISLVSFMIAFGAQLSANNYILFAATVLFIISIMLFAVSGLMTLAGSIILVVQKLR